jgi:hypothetical protein
MTTERTCEYFFGAGGLNKTQEHGIQKVEKKMPAKI